MYVYNQVSRMGKNIVLVIYFPKQKVQHLFGSWNLNGE